MWLHELPPVTSAVDAQLTAALTVTSGLGEDCSAAIEPFVPLGARFLYGMLGGRYTPDGSKVTSITTPPQADAD